MELQFNQMRNVGRAENKEPSVRVCVYIQGVPRVKVTTSGVCSLC